MDTGDLSAIKHPDSCGNTIPDFSRVGYREGHVKIPFVPVQMVVEPSLDPYSDDTARIQAAIDFVATLPLQCTGQDGARVRGAVLLRAGTYRVAGALIINASGVILRGEGQDDKGTIVVATGAIQRDFILVNGMLTSDMGTVEMQQTKARTREMMPTNGYRGSKKPVTYTKESIYIPTGTTHIPVQSTFGYNVGDGIVVGQESLFSQQPAEAKMVMFSRLTCHLVNVRLNDQEQRNGSVTLAWTNFPQDRGIFLRLNGLQRRTPSGSRDGLLLLIKRPARLSWTSRWSCAWTLSTRLPESMS